MIVHELELENFGRLGYLKAELNGNIIGVEGPSGRGKSTLLQALRFAVTGQMDDDTLASFMRDGGKHGKTYVRVRFSQGGVSGTIERNITKTTSGRKLTVDGDDRVLTAAKEVDQRMLSLLGADPRAIAGCVFVPQGQIYSVLFGDQTEREDRFTKMLGLSHFASIQRAISTSFNAISGTLTDMSAPKQSNAEALDLCVRDLAAAQSGLDVRRPAAQLKTEVEALRTKCINAAKAGSTAAWLREAWNQVNQDIGSSNALVSRIAALTNWVASTRASEAARTAQRQAAEEWLAANGKVKLDDTNLATAKQRLSRAITSHELLKSSDLSYQKDGTLIEQLSVIDNEIKALESYVHARAQHHLAAQKEEQWRTASDDAEAASESCDYDLEEARAECTKWHDANSSRLTMLQLRIAALGQAHVGADTHCCPVCEQSLVGVKHAAQWLEEIRAEVRTMQDAYQRLEDKASELAVKSREADTAFSQAKREHHLASGALQTASSIMKRSALALTAVALKEGTTDEITQLLNTKDQSRLALKRAIASAREAAENLRRSDQDVQAASAEVALFEAMLKSSQERLNRATVALQATTGMVEVKPGDAVLLSDSTAIQLSKSVEELKALEAQQKLVTERSQRYEARYEELKALAAALNQDGGEPFAAVDAAVIASASWQSDLAKAEEEMSEVNNLSERIRLLREQHVTYSRKAEEIRQIELRDAGRLSVVQRLRTMSDAFDKTGISRSYLADVYGNVLNAMNVYLSQMGAPLEVRPADKVFTFEFRRTDEESEWMSQSKLSGGQKVRTSVAFLLATQSLIIPQVGLLVLDEPSMHLDRESQEGMRDLLMDMSAQLRRSDKQVIISDHCPVFHPAFDTCVVI